MIIEKVQELEAALKEVEQNRSEMNAASAEHAKILEDASKKVAVSREKYETSMMKAQGLRREVEDSIDNVLPRESGKVSR